jgi:general secretion pathway protein G
MKIRKLNAKGFTLIELLIVIIIIGILATIAIVAYSGSQNKAKQTAANGNLTNVKNKLAEYNADNGKYPASQSDLDTWLGSTDGGNNQDLAGKFVSPDYTYTPSPSGCDNASGGDCTGYSITAKSTWGGSDLSMTN